MVVARESRESYEAALGLAWLGQSAPRCLLRLLRQEGPEAAWRASRRRMLGCGAAADTVSGFEATRRGFDVRDAEALLARAGLWFVPYGSPLYPSELAHLDQPPAGLFTYGPEEALGRLLAAPRVTVVGTRKATPYGLRATELFASAFAARGVAVVSGMALGVDGRAHHATLEAGGLTVAVLGCGADIVYPRHHRWLHEKISRSGVVLSELPPGTAPSRWTFPHRNRMLAALGDAVLVVEASKASGALQTAAWALDLGRPVFSVPGPIFVDGHEGCNQLLYDGASPALDPCATVEDFLLQTRIERGKRRTGEQCPRATCAERAQGHQVGAVDARGRSILESLASGPSSVDSLVARTGLAVREVSAALAGLELAGLAKRAAPGIYIRAP